MLKFITKTSKPYKSSKLFFNSYTQKRTFCFLTSDKHSSSFHSSVMPNEVISSFNEGKFGLKKNKIFVDCTFGGGGHTSLLLETFSDSVVYAIDRDHQVWKLKQDLLEKYKGRLIPLSGCYSDMEKLLKPHNVHSVDGVLMDIGVSSLHLDKKERGFSFRQENDGPLDMRMDQTQDFDAYQIINKYSEKQLVDIFWKYGEDRFSGKLAQAIINERKKAPIETTYQLATLINKHRPKGKGKYLASIDPATRVFQALRIEVNQELKELALGLRNAEKLLSTGGRLVIISFQPSEDKITKEYLQSCVQPNRHIQSKLDSSNQINMDVLEKRKTVQPSFRFIHQLLQPTDKEIEINPRSRSAKLRCVERTLNPNINFPMGDENWMIDWKKVQN